MDKGTAANYKTDTITAYRKALEERERRRRAERERRRREALAAVRQAVHAVAPSYPTLERVYLYGSVIRPGAFRRDSDVDVAVEGLGAGECFDLWQDLEQAAPAWNLDVRPLKPDDHFSDRVRQRGVIIYG
ncbi:MAG: nucleotidyltransferase domain-containing protein [Chloroflexota bacterium]|nr:nucleotidyltransferase domain-containing protein [Chloroflexota bacterium]